nr:uncharacterized protein LOC109175033 [Ipomoea batatas]
MGCKRNAKIRKLGAVVDVPSSPEPDVEDGQQGTPLRPIFCLKRREQLREFDNKEECFILDFDPFDSSRPVSENLDPEIAVVAEKGNVACRDFPHARYVCAEFPFGTTPHEKCCKLALANCLRPQKLKKYAHLFFQQEHHSQALQSAVLLIGECGFYSNTISEVLRGNRRIGEKIAIVEDRDWRRSQISEAIAAGEDRDWSLISPFLHCTHDLVNCIEEFWVTPKSIFLLIAVGAFSTSLATFNSPVAIVRVLLVFTCNPSGKGASSSCGCWCCGGCAGCGTSGTGIDGFPSSGGAGASSSLKAVSTCPYPNPPDFISSCSLLDSSLNVQFLMAGKLLGTMRLKSITRST